MGQVRTVRRESSCPTISTSSASAKHGGTKRLVLESRGDRRRETEAIVCVILCDGSGRYRRTDRASERGKDVQEGYGTKRKVWSVRVRADDRKRQNEV